MLEKQMYRVLDDGRVAFLGQPLSDEEHTFLTVRGYVHVGGLAHHKREKPSCTRVIGTVPNMLGNFGTHDFRTSIILPTGQIYVRETGGTVTYLDEQVRKRFAPEGTGDAYVPGTGQWIFEDPDWMTRQANPHSGLVYISEEM